MRTADNCTKNVRTTLKRTAVVKKKAGFEFDQGNKTVTGTKLHVQ